MSSTLLSIQNLSKSYGTQTLFERLSLSISSYDRIGLVGPNGAGKTTLLKIIMNLEDSGEGEIIKRQNLKIGYASQAPEFPDTSVENVLLENVPSGEEEQRLTRARILLGKAQFSDFSISAQTLSGGWKKRLDIILALCQEPDLLILDEPTNHLDLEGILWLEQFLQKEHPSYIIVSHDRYFLNTVCNQIV
jgi:ABC transport system ATP-binding/permease protein